MPRILLAVLLLAPARPQEDIDLVSIPDAWPKAPRNVGQKFGMNTRDTIPTDLGGGESDSSDEDEIAQTSRRTRYRLVGVKVVNRRAGPLEASLSSPQIQGQRKELRIRSGEWTRCIFLVPEKKGQDKLTFELRNSKAEVLRSIDVALDPKAKSGSRSEAALIAAELQEELATRSRFERSVRTVEVRDENGRPLKGADLAFVQPKIGMMVSGKADEAGTWSGALLVGDWQVYARAVVKPEVPTGGTVAIGNPRLYYLCGILSQLSLKLAPDQSAALMPAGERVGVTPTAFAEFLRYETIHARLAAHFLLTSETSSRVHPVLVHSSAGLTYDVFTYAAPPKGQFLYSPRLVLKGDLALDRAKPAVLTFDPSRIPAQRLEITVSFPDAPRERFSFSAVGATEFSVPAGPVRVEMTAILKEGAKIRFAPHLVKAQPGKPIELASGSFRVSPHFQETRGLMVWVGLEDDQGKIVTRLEGVPGTLTGTGKGKELFKEELKGFTFHYPTPFEKVNLPDIHYEISIEMPGGRVAYSGKARPRKVFTDPPGSVEVPEILEERARSFMPTIRKTLAGGYKYLAVAKFDLRVCFEIRLPPEVGGMGGGGVMLLDLGEILEYAHETDRLPGAYTHELGHNFGYGHDPYMTMAPCSDEGLYDSNGYVLLNGFAPTRLLQWLDRDTEPAEWNPSGDLWPTLRMLYGPEVHNRMVALKRKFAERLDNAGVSIAEQVAAYYSMVTGDNLAWMFRAFGWPVFDYRVRLAQAMIQQQSLASQGKLPAKIDGSYLSSWWMRGPMPVRGGGEKPPWKIHRWDGRFLLLATEENFLQDAAYHFYLTVQSQEPGVCLLSIASDVQVSFYVNGKRISRVAAAPQFSQPVHEGYTMERANATVVPVTLAQGDNIFEMVVVRTAGSKGMWIELANGFGKPLQGVGTVLGKGPEDLETGEKVIHPVAAPVFNPSFELGMASWIQGAKDGDGEISVVIDDKVARDGRKSVRIEAKGPLSGSVIQRLVLEEDAKYELTAWIHTEGFREKSDRAYVGLFTGNPNEGMVVQTEVIEKSVSGWQKVTLKYKADRRTIYLGCILKGAAGARVWFDSLQLVKVK